MKIRNGFVSNSSSSSFIIAFDKNYDIKNIDNYIEIVGIKNVLNELKKWYYIGDHVDGNFEEFILFSKIVADIDKSLKNGYNNIALISVEHGNERFYNIIKNANIKIIKDFG